ncbi:MAG TPA: glycosyltransferase family 4 protein, partial [Opitutaceae bacterium]|nr:glycosyltransferase family 4 protein [Opitutaceae bacterium]
AIKGFQHQLNAIKQLQNHPAASSLYFVWAGDGDQRAALETDITRNGLSERVRILGHRWDVADWYDVADIFVLTSHFEGMPLCVMEAMAKGLPVVASAVSGIPEELGDTGKLLPDPTTQPDKTAKELAHTLVQWAASPTLRGEIGRRSQARAEKNFHEETMTKKTVALIRSHVTTSRQYSLYDEQLAASCSD